MKVKEIQEVIIDRYLFYESLNPKLVGDYIRSNFSESNKRSVKGQHTSYDTSSENIKKIYQWVIDILYSKYDYLMIEKLYPEACWFCGYGVGDYSFAHAHIPRTYSFVYFVQCPRGSSPLVFTTSGKKVKAEEGKVVIFPANIWHHVPKNKCEDRITLIGNIGVREVRLTYDLS